MRHHSPLKAKGNEVRQSVERPSFGNSFPVLQMQLQGVEEPADALLPGGQAVHSSETSEKFSLKVSTGHFLQLAPVPFLRCSVSFWLGLQRPA